MHLSEACLKTQIQQTHKNLTLEVQLSDTLEISRPHGPLSSELRNELLDQATITPKKNKNKNSPRKKSQPESFVMPQMATPIHRCKTICKHDTSTFTHR